MQKDLFLPESEAKLRDLRIQRREHEIAARKIGQEIYELIKTGTSEHIGGTSYLCLLPSGASCFYTMEGTEYTPAPRLQEFHHVDLTLLKGAAERLEWLLRNKEDSDVAARSG